MEEPVWKMVLSKFISRKGRTESKFFWTITSVALSILAGE